MNIPLFFRTIRHLKLKQVVYQLKNRIFPSKYVYYASPTCNKLVMTSMPVSRPISLKGNQFSFLNLTQDFTDWNDVSLGTLYTYNLNYFDFINDGNISLKEASNWIEKFIDDIPHITWGMDPYPIAVRGINWIKFITKYFDQIDSSKLQLWNDSLYSQYKLLERKLEWHLLGNHLLEDIYSLYIASIYFNDVKMFRKYSHLLSKELNEQILPDGSHYEQSPMYHCILLDRLLDCINISADRSSESEFLNRYAIMMLGHLSEICYRNGDIPLLNDAAYDIAPRPCQLFDYARRLGLQWESIPMKECGYRKFNSDNMEAIVDVGNITASYQPGHSHADTFNYEMRINGKPYIIDTGISTYEKNTRRQYERSTAAHNTVSVAGRDSSEVWGGFRVGRRAFVKIHEEDSCHIVASHNGFPGANCMRSFQMSEGCFVVTDQVGTGVKAKSYIHFAPEVDVISLDRGRIRTSLAEIDIQNADDIEIVDEFASVSYNALRPIKKAVISFTENLKYSIL